MVPPTLWTPVGDVRHVRLRQCAANRGRESAGTHGTGRCVCARVRGVLDAPGRPLSHTHGVIRQSRDRAMDARERTSLLPVGS